MPDRSGLRLRFDHSFIVFARCILCLIPTLLVLLSGTQLPAQVGGNADGSVCDEGFENKNGSCQRTNVPQNAYLTGSSYGRGWECNHGFKNVGELCEKIRVPENAYLASTFHKDSNLRFA